MSSSQHEPAETVANAGSTPLPSVTCVIGAYNHEKYVEEALDSAFSQTYENLRIIVFDDASTDGTQKVIREYLTRTGHEDVLFIAHEENRGLCATLNEALALIDSDYVAFIAADDVQEPHRIATQVARLEELGDAYAMVYSDALAIGPTSEVLDRSNLTNRTGPGRTFREGRILKHLLADNWIPAPTALIRHSALVAVGSYDESLAFEDYDMWLRLAAVYSIAYVDLPLVRYRILENSLSTQLFSDPPPRSITSQVNALSKHYGYGHETDQLIDEKIMHLLIRLRVNHGASAAQRWQLFRSAARTKHPRAAMLALTPQAMTMGFRFNKAATLNNEVAKS